ncbi:DMT family transporter [Rhodobium gokarnense]|uniref:Drug/metabolite transporter (DMT)-like permease n=1 Tax=Rhodobium gokarnense TaxID=364296 RepID=A0ABT3H9H6_9HYPH|nr:DMT family transporter [Rhodobium gokarnense]MCW2307047.1 drug/metabolite transporter (DMT)-like permease [Rhodobium gokarnense]
MSRTADPAAAANPSPAGPTRTVHHAAASVGVGVALAFACLAILGVMPVISNSRPAGFDALSFAVFLSLWQVVAVLPLVVGELVAGRPGIFAAALGRQQRNRTIATIIGTGAMFGLSTYLYVLTAERAGAVAMALAVQAYPLFAMLWERIFLHRRKSLAELAFTILLIGALAYLATGGTWRIAGLSLWFLLAVAIPFLWSVAHVIIKEEIGATPISPLQITFFRVAVSAAFLAAIMLATDGPGRLLDDAFNGPYQEIAALMGAVYALELVLWFYAVRSIDVSLASSITVPAPALTMVLAVLFLGEAIKTYQLAAMAVVFVAIYGLLIAGNRRRGRETSSRATDPAE